MGNNGRTTHEVETDVKEYKMQNSGAIALASESGGVYVCVRLALHTELLIRQNATGWVSASELALRMWNTKSGVYHILVPF